MKKLLGKRGFTLVELCVVMAVGAIVGTMVVTATIFIFQQNKDIQDDSSFISEVTDVQSKVNDWLKKYDVADYEISNNSGQSALTARGGSGNSTITYADNAIMIGGEKASETYKNISGITFQVIEDKAGDKVEGKLVQLKITAKKGAGTEVQTLLFALFSDKTRARSVTGKNG